MSSLAVFSSLFYNMEQGGYNRIQLEKYPVVYATGSQIDEVIIGDC